MRLSISRWNLVCLLAFGAGLGPACTVTTGGDDDPFDASTSDDFDTDDTDADDTDTDDTDTDDTDTDDTDTDDTDTDDTDTDDTDTDDTDTDEPAEPDASPPTDGSVPPPVDGSVAPNDASTPDDSGTTCGEGMCCDAGACGAEDAAAADGGCMPYEPDVAPSGDAGVPACFPSCVAELQARCMPTGECGTSSDFQSTCWDNGVVRTDAFDPATFSVSVSMLADGERCYEVLLTSDDEGNSHYSWRDSCGVEIAFGDAPFEDQTAVTVTCIASGAQETISLLSDACQTFSEGAPAGIACAPEDSCSAP